MAHQPEQQALIKLADGLQNQNLPGQNEASPF
jgi:hypothetical protein